MRPAFTASLALAALLAPSIALGRDPAAAEALFRAGREAALRGDHAEACARFTESQRLDPAPGTLINLGDCKEHLGLYASAWAHFREAADRLVDDPRLPRVKQRMEAIEPKISHITIALAKGAPTGTTITRDGEPVGEASLGVTLPVDRGSHVLVIGAPGREQRRIVVELSVGESKTIAAAPGPPLPAVPHPAVAGAPGPRSLALRNAGFVVGALGVASLATGVATGILTIRKKALLGPDHCVDQVCDPVGVQAAADGKLFSTVSTITFFAGLGALGASVGMVVAGSRGPTVIAPAVGPGVAGLSARGSF